MNDQWDASVAAGDLDASVAMYTEDAIRMQPDMPALEGRKETQETGRWADVYQKKNGRWFLIADVQLLRDIGG